MNYAEDHTISVEYHCHQYSYQQHFPIYPKLVSEIFHTMLGVVTGCKIDIQPDVGGDSMNNERS